MVKRKPTRRTPARKSPAKRAPAKQAIIKTPWELVAEKNLTDPVFLDLEWGVRLPNTVYVTGVGNVIDRSKMTPLHKYYESPDYSWQKYVTERAKDNFKIDSSPTTDTGSFTLRDDQEEDKKAIVNLLSRKDRSEFLLANGTGVGKTVVAVAAINELPGDTVLVVCPKSVIPQWRLTLRAMGDGGKKWILINYESTKKLLQHTAKSANAKKVTTKNKNLALYGTPLFKADIVVTDEAHKMRNPTSQQTKVVEKFLEKGAKSLRMTATPGENPAQIYYLRRGLTESTSSKMFTVTEDDYSEFVSWSTKQNIHGLTKARFGNGIEFTGKEEDVERMKDVIFGASPAWAARRVPTHWPQQDRRGVPIELSPEQKIAYETAWNEFSEVMKQLTTVSKKATTKKAKSDAKVKGLAAQTRYRQKIGQLKVPAAVEEIVEILDDGSQVVVHGVYSGTVQALEEALAAKNIQTVSITGSNVANREADRVRFQTGEVKVLINTIAEGISYHEGDTLVNGNNTPRETIVIEPEWSSIQMKQKLGRAHRDGKDSPARFIMAVDTIDVKVTQTLLQKIKNMNTMIGDSEDLIDDLAKDFGFELF